ncbi:hypothetical protein FB451DRAFT_1182304 [Mycena latifolia]|nr:hypothetical protein FB451DRAFT_1182304 [Mycena latifolia]
MEEGDRGRARRIYVSISERKTRMTKTRTDNQDAGMVRGCGSRGENGAPRGQGKHVGSSSGHPIAVRRDRSVKRAPRDTASVSSRRRDLALAACVEGNGCASDCIPAVPERTWSAAGEQEGGDAPRTPLGGLNAQLFAVKPALGDVAPVSGDRTEGTGARAEAHDRAEKLERSGGGVCCTAPETRIERVARALPLPECCMTTVATASAGAQVAYQDDAAQRRVFTKYSLVILAIEFESAPILLDWNINDLEGVAQSVGRVHGWTYAMRAKETQLADAVGS